MIGGKKIKMVNKITREEFNKLPASVKQNEMLEFFKQDSNNAFLFEFLMDEFQLKKSQLYQQLRILINAKLIEQRGSFYILK